MADASKLEQGSTNPIARPVAVRRQRRPPPWLHVRASALGYMMLCPEPLGVPGELVMAENRFGRATTALRWPNIAAVRSAGSDRSGLPGLRAPVPGEVNRSATVGAQAAASRSATAVLDRQTAAGRAAAGAGRVDAVRQAGAAAGIAERFVPPVSPRAPGPWRGCRSWPAEPGGQCPLPARAGP